MVVGDGRRHGRRGSSSRPTSAPTRSACRPIGGSTRAAGATPAIRCSSPSTPIWRARRRWPRRARRRCGSPARRVDDVAYLRPLLVLRELAALRVRRARASPSAIRAASPSPAACRTTAVRRAGTSRTRSRRWSNGCAPSPEALGLVSGVGMHMTKHVFGVYARRPGPVAPPDAERVQAAVDRAGSTDVVAEHDGDADGRRAYSVVHGRDGASRVGAARVRSARRWARVRASPRDGNLCADAETTELVGRTVTLTPQTVDGPAGPGHESTSPRGEGSLSKGRPRQRDKSRLLATASKPSRAATSRGLQVASADQVAGSA